MSEIAPGESLQVVPFATARPHTFNQLLCDGVTAHGLSTLAGLLSLHARLQKEKPNCRVFASLDDLGQAAYTSGHGTDVFGLDSTDGHDLSALGADAFENGQHLGYLSTPAEFPIRLANLLKLSRDVGMQQVSGVLDWETPGEPHDILSINADPDAALLLPEENGIIFQFVPVVCAADALAAFPNGYFTADLSPMQSHALARHLEGTYGLALFGIGARFLGFRARQPLGAETATALAADIATIYAGGASAKTGDLAHLLTGRDWLLLRYTES
jgi:hypothetical protein